MTTFASPLLIITLSELKHTKVIALAIMVLAVALNFSYFRPSEFLGREDDYYINRYIPVPAASAEYRTILEDYLRLPKGNEIPPDNNYPRAYAQVRANLQVREINALDAKIITDYPESFSLNYNKYYFPGWVAKIDGEPASLVAGKPYGQIAVQVPAGVHEVEITFRETNFRKVLNFISLGAILASIYLIVRRKKNR
jgi:hypothetical protein